MAANTRRGSSGIRAFAKAMRPNRNSVDVFGDCSTCVGTSSSAPRRGISVGAVGRSMLRRLRPICAKHSKSSTTDNDLESAAVCAADASDRGRLFPLCKPCVQKFLEEVFGAACAMSPPASVADVQMQGGSLLNDVFTDIAAACDECLRLSTRERHEAIHAYLARWANATQMALGSALAEVAEQQLNAARSAQGEDTPLMQSNRATFVLQLKLQALSRLMCDEYVQGMIADKHVEVPDARPADSQCMAIDASSGINASIFRSERNAIAAGNGKSGDMEPSVSLNRAAWRQPPKRVGKLRTMASLTKLPCSPESVDDEKVVASLADCAADGTPRFCCTPRFA